MIVTITFLEDTNNKPGKHSLKNSFWQNSGIEVIRQRLPVGDYVLMNDKIADVFRRKEKRGIPVKMIDLLGTYDVAIDSKNSIQELVGDICGKQHERFRDECILAQNNGIKLIILVEDNGGYCDRKETIYNKPVTCIDDLFHWKNPRLFIWYKGKQKYPRATKGQTLAKALITMEKKYGCKFLFTQKHNAGADVVRLLTERNYE